MASPAIAIVKFPADATFSNSIRACVATVPGLSFLILLSISIVTFAPTTDLADLDTNLVKAFCP